MTESNETEKVSRKDMPKAESHSIKKKNDSGNPAGRTIKPIAPNPRTGADKARTDHRVFQYNFSGIRTFGEPIDKDYNGSKTVKLQTGD